MASSGTFNAVEKILGAVNPSLYGNNDAVFSLTLDQDGAVILAQAFDDGATPIGIIYNLKFTGLQPALEVTITADLSMVYDEFSASLTAQIYYVKVGIDAAFEKLKQEGAIKIDVKNFSTSADRDQQEKWALDFFKEKILADWFRPTLKPGPVSTPPSGGGPTGPGGTPGGPGSPGGGIPGGNPGGGIPGGTPGGGIPGGPGGGTPGGGTPGGGIPGIPHAPAGTTAQLVTATIQAAGKSPSGGGGGGITPPKVDTAPVSFKLSYVHKEELKTVKFELNRSQAVQRLYCPQGSLGLMVANLDRSKHFIEVDLDNPFFRRFQVVVDAPIDFQKYGLLSGHAALDYGSASDPAGVKHGESIFDNTNRGAKFTWDVSMDGFVTTYNSTVDYHFDPNSGWQANKDFYQLPTVTTENRQLSLDPTWSIGFLEVKIFPHQIDRSIVTAIDVTLNYSGPDGEKLSNVVNVTPDSPVQFWRARVNSPASRSYSYSFLHHFKTGQTNQGDMITTQASYIAVNDPFRATIDIQFVPLFDATKTRMVLVDVQYDDQTNQYHREEHLTLNPSPGNQPVPLTLSILDPNQITYSYRLTFVDQGNQLHRGAWTQTTDTIIGVSES